MSTRFIVVAGSESGHCCFEFTVVDTTKTRGWGSIQPLFEQMCECMDFDVAQQIADALNATTSRTSDTGGASDV